MGRPRTPTNILEARGAFKKNPGRARARANEPEVRAPVGGPPEGWVEQAKHNMRYAEYVALWKEICASAPAGVLTVADRPLVELYCRKMYSVRRDLDPRASDVGQIVSILAKFGMTPSDRSRVYGTPKPGGTSASGWEEFA